jgi:O-antigen/teichoic acid export membrane protein
MLSDMVRSIFSNWVGLAVLATSTALLTPIMIHHLGALDYGVWVLAGSILDYYGLLDIGMRSAMFRYVGLFRGNEVREEVDRTFTSALFTVVVTAVVIFFLSIGVAYFLPRSMNLQDTSPQVFSWLLLLLGFSIGITFPTRMLATYISAHQRWDLFNAAGIAAVITRTVAIVVVLKLGYGLLAVAIAALVVAFLSLGQHIFFVRIADRRVRVSLRLVSGRRIRELFGFSLRSLLVSVGDYLRFYSDSAVIAAVLNVALITPFSVATRLIECFKSVIVAAGGPVFGMMTELDGGHRDDDSRELLLKSTRLLALLSVLGGTLLLVDGRALLRIWVGRELVAAYPLLAVLAAGYTINLALHPLLLTVIAKGKHGPLGAWTIAEGAVNIGLSILWGRSYGLLGIAMGTVVPMLVVKLIIQPYYALKAAEMSLWTFLRRGLVRPLIVGLLFFGAALVIALRGAPDLPVFIAMVLAQVALFMVIGWTFGVTKTESQWLRRYGHRYLRCSISRAGRPILESQKPAFDGRE